MESKKREYTILDITVMFGLGGAEAIRMMIKQEEIDSHFVGLVRKIPGVEVERVREALIRAEEERKRKRRVRKKRGPER